MNLYENLNKHFLKEPYDRSKGQIDKIIELCETIEAKTGKFIQFDNTRGFNHYVLFMDGVVYDFNLYRDVIAALELVLACID